MSNTKAHTISTSCFADICGVNRKTIAEWALTWLAPAKVGNGIFIARQASALWIENIIIPRYATPSDGESVDDAKRRKESALADKAELLVKQLRESLVPRDKAVEWVSSLVDEAKTGMMAIPRRLAPELFGKEIREIEERIDAEIKRVLHKLARGKEQNGKRTKGDSVTVATAGEPEGKRVGRKKQSSDRGKQRRTRTVEKQPDSVSRRDNGRIQRTKSRKNRGL